MESYSPLNCPDPDEWLALDEDERINLVEDFHVEHDDDLLDDTLHIHSTIHVIVENQLALKEVFIPETIAKLTRQGLDRHEAIHAIGAILSENIYDLLKGDKTEFPIRQYRRKLEKLTAKRWRKGKW